jgi:xylulose-5-phosphate/fructose-6-phosphate phosphoketolase
VTTVTTWVEAAAADSPVSATGDTVAPPPYPVSSPTGPLTGEELAVTEAWWRSANYLAVAQIYLRDNALLNEPLLPEHVKPGSLGTPGPSRASISCKRTRTGSKARGLSAMIVADPGDGGPGPNAGAWLEGTDFKL